MKGTTVRIRLDREMQRMLDRLCRLTGRSRSEIVRHPLRRELTLRDFEVLRRRTLPLRPERAAT